METKAETLTRFSSPELDEILGKPFKVLNDGFVRVVDYMGTDESIVQAARVSYGKGTKTRSNDRELIRYLMRHRHTSPFEMCEIKLHVRVPMDTWRQWIRHRTANVNEYSTRYSVAIDSCYSTDPSEWRKQSTDNKQGSSGFFEAASGEGLTKKEADLQKACFEEYKRRVEMGVAREQARKDLPLSTYTEAYWKIDLANLLHFLSLRMEQHAQLEIRTYSEVIGNEIVKKWCPFAWEAFSDYTMESLSISRIEQKIIVAIAAGKNDEAVEAAKSSGLLKKTEKGFKSSFECGEIEEKLSAMGLSAPWK